MPVIIDEVSVDVAPEPAARGREEEPRRTERTGEACTPREVRLQLRLLRARAARLRAD